MLPARWLRVDEFPVNANGKIDRGRLRRLAHSEAS
jgi:acyl-coenzyme A synthetase/AMP-(fatty) acid ligase